MEAACNQLANALQCSVCGKLPSNPYTATICGHHYCFCCVSNAMKMARNLHGDGVLFFSCPVCRQSMPLRSVHSNETLATICSLTRSLQMKLKSQSDSLLLETVQFCKPKPPIKPSHASKCTALPSSDYWKHYTKSIVLCTSSVGTSDVDLIKSTMHSVSPKLKLASTWSSKQVHILLVTASSESAHPADLIPRTSKCLLSILHGIPVLSMDWYFACLASNQLVDPRPFQLNRKRIQSDTTTPAPSRKRSDIFASQKFHIVNSSNWNSNAPSPKDLRAFIQAGRGRIVPIKSASIIITPDETAKQDKRSKPYTWLIDSIISTAV